MGTKPTDLLHPRGPLRLLPWQIFFAGFLCAGFAGDAPAAALTAALLIGLATARGRQPLLLAAGFGMGLLLWALAPKIPDALWDGQHSISGKIDSVRGYPGGRLHIVVSDVRDVQTGEPMPGRLLWTWRAAPENMEAGQRFSARLKIRPVRGSRNFGLGNTDRHWHGQGIFQRTFSFGRADVHWTGSRTPGLRQRLMDKVGRAVSGPGGAFVRALLFGDRAQLDPVTADRVRRAGLSHSLALSGMHLTLVAVLGFCLAWLAVRIYPAMTLHLPRQKLGLLLALPFAGTYLWLGGCAPSLLRAAVMLGVLAWHQLSGTRRYLQDSLLTAALVLIILDPQSIHDIGLQLSVLAVFGIICFMPFLQQGIDRLPLLPVAGGAVRLLVTVGALSICANLFILPLQAVYFNEVTPALWLNLLWIPVLSLVVLPLCFAGLGLLTCAELPGRLLLTPAAWCCEKLDSLLQLLDESGWLQAIPVLRPDGLHIVGYWTVLLVCAVLWSGLRPEKKCVFLLATGLSLIVLPDLVRTPWNPADAELGIFDTGMSQAVYIRTPGGRTVLVDGAGAWGGGYDPGQSIVAPGLSWRHAPDIDIVLASHIDADHVRGLNYVLRHLRVGWFGWTNLPEGSEDDRRLRASLQVSGVPVRMLRAGQRIPLDHGLFLEVLYPPASATGYSENNSSLVLRLIRQGRGLALIPGDVEEEGIAALLASGQDLQADVLVLPHHGSRSSLQPALYAAVRPRYAVAACSRGNRFGFPHKEVVRACRSQDILVLTTADQGGIVFSWSEENRVAVQTAREVCPGPDIVP